jgi:peptidoglycan L-alanyl-D-glutamate endopeptidase CwlK
MAAFFLGNSSEEKLQGVDPQLVRCVRRAICTTEVDFTVFEGMRSLERQRELVAKGVSRTLNSYHLTGHAVDLVPWVAGRAQWQAPACIKVAMAMREAALHFGIGLTWGAVWDRALASLPVGLDDAIDAYVARFRAATGRKPLVDMPHFQIDRA